MNTQQSQRVAFATLGCKLNYAESSTLSRQFEAAGYVVVPPTQVADVYVINTCSVTEHSDKKCRNIIRRLSKRNPDAIVAVTGGYAQLKAEEIAVGLPKNMDGSEGFRAEACKEFAQLLSEYCGIKTVLRDERLTTVSAHKFMSMNDVRGKKRKNTVDAVSAVIILEDYIAYRKNTLK